jgi:general secretion pathway protein G
MRSGNNRRRAGYTLIELIIVMAIISILLATAVPMYQKSLVRTKQSRFALRAVIDEYCFDKQKAPQILQDLKDQGYLRGADPVTGSNQPGSVIKECDGTLYAEW